jgi:hypothetical protein
VEVAGCLADELCVFLLVLGGAKVFVVGGVYSDGVFVEENHFGLWIVEMRGCFWWVCSESAFKTWLASSRGGCQR